MSTHVRSLFTAITLLLACGVNAIGAEPDGEPHNKGVVVGVFDSRAVAAAYYRSAAFGQKLAGLRARQQRAKETGDEAAVAKFDKLGRGLQDRAHKQTFGAEPIDSLLTEIGKDDLATIADNAGVDLLVSKWEVAFQRGGAAVKDVTDDVVELFHPDEKTRGVIRDLQKTKPVQADELKVEI